MALSGDARWLVETPIAHRGLHDEVRPENSLAAFGAAMAAGCAIELDVHRLADGAVAVFHDDTLDRMTDAAGPLGAETATSLARRRLRRRPPTGAPDGERGELSGERVPLLGEVLEQVGGDVPLLIELKQPDGAPIGPLEEALARALRGYRGAVAVQSFNPLSLADLFRRAPWLLRGQLSGTFEGEALAWYKKALLRRLLLCPLSWPRFVAYEHEALPYWATSAARRLFGVPLIAWTIRDAETLARVAPHVDNVIFEDVAPEQVRAVTRGPHPD